MNTLNLSQHITAIDDGFLQTKYYKDFSSRMKDSKPKNLFL